MTSGAYVFDNAATEAGQRFDALSALFDPTTFRHIEALGISDGWSCWEVGAGGPTVANWLADRAGPNGYVLASDINTSWADKHVRPTVNVRTHDVTKDPLPSEQFDLVHARLVLSHLSARGEALRRMVAALKPGGWLLVEDFDDVLPLNCIDSEPSEHKRANDLHTAMRALLTRRGADLTFARKLPRLLRALGLDQVRADAYFAVALPSANILSGANINQVRDVLVSEGLATDKTIDAHLHAIADGTIELGTVPLISAWGQQR